MGYDFSKIKTICVVGLKNTPERPCYYVSEYLKEQGFRVIPVNPTGEDVLGEKAYSNISDIPAEIKIDLADYFIRSENVAPLVQEALDRGIESHWLQQGIVNEEAASMVEEKGGNIVMNRCIMVAHRNQK